MQWSQSPGERRRLDRRIPDAALLRLEVRCSAHSAAIASPVPLRRTVVHHAGRISLVRVRRAAQGPAPEQPARRPARSRPGTGRTRPPSCACGPPGACDGHAPRERLTGVDIEPAGRLVLGPASRLAHAAYGRHRSRSLGTGAARGPAPADAGAFIPMNASP